MFTVTKEWLFENYGSKYSGQVQQTKEWLLKYGIDVPQDKLDEWAQWKHLSEYQVNTPQIVPRCLSMIGLEFRSELAVHRCINIFRVPLAISYEMAMSQLEDKPRKILELGVGGDSAISTAIFLNWVELEEGGFLTSIEHNPLGVTWDRYKKYINKYWNFIQMDSIEFLRGNVGKNKWDMIFIDTSHSYLPTYTEISFASLLTENILMDDTTFEGNIDDSEPGGVKRAIEEWYNNNKNIWNIEFYHNGAVALLTKE